MAELVTNASAEPPVRGETVLRLLERPFLAVDRFLDRWLPEELNPLLQTGAIANTTFAVAMATGVALLLWYVPSIHQAHDSVTAMHAETPLTGGLMRSLHRYSSDACVFFVLVHALKLFFARRFGGARWLAWVTGVFAVLVLWLTGWTGYWLVWDERARQVALASAKFLDVLPIFIDPLSRSFLIDEAVNTLLFFVIFFVHMLVPVGAVVALWLHITRLRRATWITRGPMTWWVLGSLVVLSLAFPADVVEPARLAVEPDAFAMDWWYLAPLLLAERLSVGAGWGLMLGGGIVFFAIPWLMARQRAVTAVVDEARCNSCRKCETDCPYAAISMAPRTDGKPFEAVAMVDPSLCVGCSICSGSCDTGGVGVELWSSLGQRRRVSQWMADGDAAGLAIVCAETATSGLVTDPATGTAESLPGWRVLAVPCAGQVHPLVVEKALRAGAEHVVFGACGTGDCRFREGADWTAERMAGAREPELRSDKVDASRVRVVRGTERQLRDALAELGDQPEQATPPSSGGRVAVGVAVAAILTLAVALPSVGPWRSAAGPEPVLTVTLKHPGQVGEDCRAVTEQELADTPVHMRRAEICERRRADVRLQVSVDGVLALDTQYEPKGIWGDGNSIALERLAMTPGPHEIAVRLADGLDTEAWGWSDTRTLEFVPRERHVVMFRREDGFGWH
ncbi:MAG: hydrogenase iron-sulfur subunit [Proteobacteria bacterium]|nr:hydrogenase iron-sulfur subunit [Pseudomonadota bacterium]